MIMSGFDNYVVIVYLCKYICMNYNVYFWQYYYELRYKGDIN